MTETIEQRESLQVLIACNERCYELIKDTPPNCCVGFNLKTTDFLLHYVILFYRHKELQIDYWLPEFIELVEAGYPISKLFLDCIHEAEWNVAIEFLNKKSLIPADYRPIKCISGLEFVDRLKSCNTKTEICQQITDYKIVAAITTALNRHRIQSDMQYHPLLWAISTDASDLVLESFVDCEWEYECYWAVDYLDEYFVNVEETALNRNRFKFLEKFIKARPKECIINNMSDLSIYVNNCKRSHTGENSFYLAACLYQISRTSEISFMRNTKTGQYIKRYKRYLACIFHAIYKKSDLPPIPKDVSLYMSEFL